MHNQAPLSVAADLDELAAVRDYIETRAIELGAAPAAVYDLVLAANEIATNIVVHGYRGRPGTIDIQIQPDGDAIAITLRDHTPPFDPNTAPTPDITVPLAQRPRGGMGIHLTRRLTDTMLHRIMPDGGNELVLIKRGVLGSALEE